MRMHAMIQNTPSQISSALPQMLRASVYQTAMKAAPRHRQTAKPRSAPNHTCKHESAAVHREQQRRATCLIRRLRNAISSSPIAFLMNERRTETMIDASSVSITSALGHFKERWRATSKNDEKDGDRKYIDSHLPMGEVEPGRDPLPETR